MIGWTMDIGATVSAYAYRPLPKSTTTMLTSQARLLTNALMTDQENCILTSGSTPTAFFCMYMA